MPVLETKLNARSADFVANATAMRALVDDLNIKVNKAALGGEQAASVLATVKRDGIEGKGGSWSAEEEDAFKAPIKAQYEVQGHPYFATARLWDDGVIDPADTRRVLALGLSAAMNAPIPETRFGVFRM